MGKRKTLWWVELNLTDREFKLFCRAAGVTPKYFQSANTFEVEDFIRKAAIEAANARYWLKGKRNDKSHR